MNDLGGKRPKTSRIDDGFQIDKELFEKSIIHKNISQEFVITTEDKIRLSGCPKTPNIKIFNKSFYSTNSF